MTTPGFKIEVTENYNYNWRSLFSWSFVGAIFILIVIWLKYSGSVSWMESSILLLIVFLIVVFFSDDIMRQRYFITTFEIENEKVSIAYKDRMRACEANGSRQDFTVEKIVRQNKYSNTIYLEITQGEKTILQYTRGDWDEAKFDAIVANFSNS